MPTFANLPIMPRESKNALTTHAAITTPYPSSASAATRGASIWNAADDEILLQARASGLNWGPISRKHFPNKTANACRKRHERLIERRQVEDWDVEKLELLAQEYMAVRKEMWEVLGNRLGERWSVVEAKCMEKGFKNLQAAARSSQRRSTSNGQIESLDDNQLPIDRNSDSGIGLGSDGEMDVDHVTGHRRTPASWHAYASNQPLHYSDHTRSNSLPQPLPLYQPPPPPPLNTDQRRAFEGPMMASPATLSYAGHPHAYQRYSPESQNGRGGISIQSVLSPADPQRA